MVILVILVIVAVAAPVIAPYAPNKVLIGVEPIKMRSGALHPPARLPGRQTAAHPGRRRQRPRLLQPHRLRRARFADGWFRHGWLRHRHRDRSRRRRGVCRQLGGQRHHAHHGRAAGLPCAAAGHRHRHRAWRGAGQCVARDRHRVHSGLRPRRARQRAVREGMGIRHGRPGGRRAERAHPVAQHPAPHAHALDRRGHAWASRPRSWTPRPCRFSAWAHSRRWRNGARCWARSATRSSPRRTWSSSRA